jgi:flavin reductase (DIM6/NTAB) family NADH-FMN oxidoreductase RutF
MSKFGYGLYVVTAAENGADNGCVVNTVMQVTSAEPFIAIMAMNKANRTHNMIINTGAFNISVLDESAPFALIEKFGFNKGNGSNKFVDYTDIKRSGNGIIYLSTHSNAYVSCEVAEISDYGTHSLFKARIVGGEVTGEGESLTYAHYRKHIKPQPQSSPTKGYICGICGYIYSGGTLPADYICPLCSHGAADFTAM